MINENDSNSIVAFNDVFISCFINPIYSIVCSYNKSTVPLLIDNTFTYSNLDDINNNSKGLIFLNLENRKGIFEILKEIGVNALALPNSKHIINDIKRLIRDNKFVLTQVDCFAIPGIPRDGKGDYYYNNFHHSNYIFIYDYDENNKCFKIINSIGNITKKSELSYENVINGYRSYVENCEDGYGLIEFENCNQNNNLNMDDYINIYIDNIHKSKSKIKQGLEQLSIAYEYFLNNTLDDSKFKTLCNDYGPIITRSVMKHSKIQHYQLEVLFPDETEIKSIRNTIASNWVFLRNSVISCKNSKKYDQTLLLEACNKFKEICDLENQYYDWVNKI